MKASQISNLIEKEAPLNLAESWDNVGYQIGAPSDEIKKVLLTLDINKEVVNEAIQNEADMIISHHPFFFSGIKQINPKDYKGSLIKDILENKLTVYSAHTNLDKAANGINEFIAQRLKLKDIKPLRPDYINSQFYKLVIYVPESHFEEVRNTLFKYEVGKIDSENYRNCTFAGSGEGTFEPIEKAQPAIGEVGELEKVKEIKLETVIPKKDVQKILTAISKIHPYEEMAYDLFKVEPQNVKTREGLGRIGKTDRVFKSDNFILFLKKRLKLKYLREAGKRPKHIRKVAICTGAGSEFIIPAKRKGADVLITGDLKYHEAQRAQEAGIWVLDAGHFGTEKQVVSVFREILKPVEDQVEILAAQSSQDYINLI